MNETKRLLARFSYHVKRVLDLEQYLPCCPNEFLKTLEQEIEHHANLSAVYESHIKQL